MKSPRLRTVALNVLVAAAAALASLALAEIGVRTFAPQPTGPSQFAFDPVRGDIPVPGQHGRRTLPGVYDYTYANNSLGLRGPEIDFSDTAKRRVLVLGDSFAYGVGVSDEQTSVSLLGRYLASRDPSLEVVNAGDPGVGTDYELKFYRTLGTRLKPRLVALYFFANDFEDNSFAKYYAVDGQGAIVEQSLSGSVGSRKQALSGNRFYNWLISRSQAANLLKQFAINLMLRGRVAGDGPPAGVIAYHNDNGYSDEANTRVTGVLLGALRDEVARDRADFIVFYVPPRENVALFQEKGALSRDESALTGICQALKIPLYSLTPLLASQTRDLSALYFAEGHWTALAHGLVAEFVSSAAAERLHLQ
ncbi:MAG: hypothetical protein HQK81_09830 [Desulfovibrionaceae bacterium]|nr:hypothetical protein [Desulfovibrionaceae bacterium]MBF0514338.1 hypothetical protein [Desulfovibrionaceae bacterium]